MSLRKWCGVAQCVKQQFVALLSKADKHIMKNYTVSFFGHRIVDVPFPVEQALEKIICQLLRDNEESYRAYYDEIEVCANPANVHFKRAYQTRNRAMVDRSDLVVFCIDHESGGAWQTMRYAKKLGVPYINIHDDSVWFRF